MVSQRPLTVCSATFLSSALSFANAISIIARQVIVCNNREVGLKSGLYGGRNRSLAPAASIYSRTEARLWLERLSIMTTSSESQCRDGHMGGIKRLAFWG
jgi:hypothetical protein